MIVRMKICTIRQSRFSYKISSELEYGLHFAAVLSRRDPRFAGGALEVQQIPKLAYGLHFAKVVTGELASAKAVSEGTK